MKRNGADLIRMLTLGGLMLAGAHDAWAVPSTTNSIDQGTGDPSRSSLQSVLGKKASMNLAKFPIGFFTDRLSLGDPVEAEVFKDGRAAEEWAAAGCTFMLSPHFTSEDVRQKELVGEILRACSERDIKMLLLDRRFYQRKGTKGLSDDAYRAEIAEANDFFSAFPAFAGFYVEDEPGKAILDNVLHAARLHKEVRPESIALVNLGFEPEYVGKSSWSDYFGSVIQDGRQDMLCYDIYVQMLADSKIPYYFSVLRQMREASLQNGVPFWTILLGVGHMHFRCPTYDDIRWQFNTAICAGSSGVLWFFYYQGDTCANYRLAPIDMNGDKTDSWHHFRRVHLDFLNHYGNLFNRLVSTRVTHYPRLVGGVQWTPNAILSGIQTDLKDHPLVIGEFTDKEARDYLMVVNAGFTNSVAVTLTFPQGSRIFHYRRAKEHEGRALEHGGPIVEVPEGFSIKHWLAPGQEVVYRVAPPETTPRLP